AEVFADRLAAAMRARDDLTRWVIVAAEPMTDVDSTGADILGRLIDDLERDGVKLAFAELKGPVKDRLRDYGLYDRIGDDHFFPTLGTAIRGYLATTGIVWVDWSDEDGNGSPESAP
ncbi:MAG TPA: sodium-independent anion transporter, partial [Acidimicrobiia bacterium]